MLLHRVNLTLVPYDQAAQEALQAIPFGKAVEVSVKAGGVTDQQRKAVFVYCTQIAKALNDAGHTRKIVIGGLHEIETDWSKDSVYENIWCEIQKVVLGTQSVRTLEKQQLDDVYQTINRDLLITKFGIHIPFPRWEHLAK